MKRPEQSLRFYHTLLKHINLTMIRPVADRIEVFQLPIFHKFFNRQVLNSKHDTVKHLSHFLNQKTKVLKLTLRATDPAQLEPLKKQVV